MSKYDRGTWVMGGAIIIGLLAVGYILVSYAFIWAINTLFNTGIVWNFWTGVAALTLLFIFTGGKLIGRLSGRSYE